MSEFLYLLKGARGSYNTEINGYEFSTSMILNDIEGDNDITVGFNALTDSRVPLAGSDLSSVSSDLAGCWLREIDYEITGRSPDGLAIVRLDLKFQSSRWGILRIDAGNQLNQVQTNLDIFGDPIVLEYTYPDDYGGTNPSEQEKELQGQTKEQGGTVTVQKSENTRVYTVREQVDPLVVAAAYGGTLNSFLWWGGEPGTWLCSIEGGSDNSGVSVSIPIEWINRYVFQYKAGGWDPEAVYSDVLTSEPVPVELFDVTNPDAMKKVESYLRTDFWDLFQGSP